MMRRENGRVVIDLSEEDWDGLLRVLGFAWASARTEAAEVRTVLSKDFILRLANAVNEGNPRWTPYAGRDDPKAS